MANTGKRPQKRRIEGGGRVTPKGGATPQKTPSESTRGSGPGVSSRYTPPVPSDYYESPRWVPILMFTLFGIGMIVIFLHYVDLFLPGASSNWWLFAGLGSILGGIITATQLR